MNLQNKLLNQLAMAKEKEAEALFHVPIYIETDQIKLGALHAHNLTEM